MLSYYRAMRQREPSDPPARIALPTLALWGAEDSFLERYVVEEAAALCDDGRLVWVEGATHGLELNELERVNEELIRFLKG